MKNKKQKKTKTYLEQNRFDSLLTLLKMTRTVNTWVLIWMNLPCGAAVSVMNVHSAHLKKHSHYREKGQLHNTSVKTQLKHELNVQV